MAIYDLVYGSGYRCKVGKATVWNGNHRATYERSGLTTFLEPSGSNAYFTRLNNRFLYPLAVPNTNYNIITDGLLAEYRFDEGAGTQLTDYSGNGQHGTLDAGGEAPTWDANGLIFAGGQHVDIPINEEDVQTLIAYITPTTGSQTFPSVLGTSGGIYWGLEFPAIRHTGYWYPLTYGGAFLNRPISFHPGAKVVSWVSDTADKMYMNGINISDSAAGDSRAASRAGSLSIGTAQFGDAGNGFNGTIRHMLIYNRTLTASEIQENTGYMRTMFPNTTSYQNTSSNRVLICLGDSITYGAGITEAQSWPVIASLSQTYGRLNLGLSGHKASHTAATINAQIPPLVSSNAPKNVVTVLLGINDLSAGNTPAQVFANIETIVTGILAAGAKAVICPLISNSFLDAERTTLNGLITGLSGTDIYIVNTADAPNLFPNGSSVNGTYFQDGIHPTAAGAAELAGAFANTINSIG